jgi:hypothetical protein
MTQTYRLSVDGEWWGAPGYWISAVTADGALRWNGTAWSTPVGVSVPPCLETRDPQAMNVNRQGRMTLRQALGLAPRLLGTVFRVSGIVGFGCGVDLLWLVFLGIGVLIALVGIPLVLLLVLLEWGVGLPWEEGALWRAYNGKRRMLSVGGTVVAARGLNVDRMVDGAIHRIYFTRLSHSLVNYERLGGQALAIATERAT